MKNLNLNKIKIKFKKNLCDSELNLFIPRPNSEALKKLHYRGAITWNSLHSEAKQATSLNNFLALVSQLIYY